MNHENVGSPSHSPGYPGGFDPGSTETAPSLPQSSGRDRLQVLTSEEADVVEVLTAQLIPGARESGVVRHIDRELATLPDLETVPTPPLGVYRVGIALIQAHACRSFGRPVQQLGEAEVEALLWDMLEGSIDGFDTFSPIEFFRLLRRHTAEGMERDIA